MSEEKVKVVFEFDKKDYENVLFLMDQENDVYLKEYWDVMSERDVVLSLDYISEQTGQKKRELLLFMVSIAIIMVKKRYNSLV